MEVGRVAEPERPREERADGGYPAEVGASVEAPLLPRRCRSAEEETSEVVVVVVVLVTVGSSTSEVQCTSSDAHNHENAMWNPVSEIGKGKPEKARMCLLKRMTEAEREIQREAAATFWRAAARAEEEEVEDEEVEVEVEEAEGGRGGLVLFFFFFFSLLVGEEYELTASLAVGTLGGGDGAAMVSGRRRKGKRKRRAPRAFQRRAELFDGRFFFLFPLLFLARGELAFAFAVP